MLYFSNPEKIGKGGVSLSRTAFNYSSPNFVSHFSTPCKNIHFLIFALILLFMLHINHKITFITTPWLLLNFHQTQWLHYFFFSFCNFFIFFFLFFILLFFFITLDMAEIGVWMHNPLYIPIIICCRYLPIDCYRFQAYNISNI